ncbi:MAG: phosphodiester glycosidase family protein [Clostridia bacterium]|nr:phosphodiester glycosidase family protein [Clostridia bacterium]
MKRTLAIVLALMLALSFVISASAVPMITGEDDGFTKEIYDGVNHTYVSLAKGSTYDLQKVNIVEFDLKDTSLDLQILKKDRISFKNTIPTYVTRYNADHEDSQVLAAVNGDFWMTGVHSNTNVTKSILTIPRGVLISDGVIYCSSQIVNETTYTTNGEGHGYFWGFGITYDYVPMIGQPVVTVNVNNTTKGLNTSTEALNRLPAHDSLVVYTGDCGPTNYALDDAYEIVLSDISGSFKCGETVKGTVSAIYDESNSENPELTMDTIVLTARGTAIDSVKDYAIGDSVEFTVSIRDVSGRDNDWSKAKLCIGGAMCAVLDGVSTNSSDNTYYPATIIGYKNDGSMFMLQNDGRNPEWSKGFLVSQQDDFLISMGVNSCISLDGGGSSTMVVGEELVNRPSDGSTRPVINGIALVTTKKDRAEQGELDLKVPHRFDASYLAFDSEGAVGVMNASYKNAATVSNNNGTVRLTADTTNDPYVDYSIGGSYKKLSANEYKYIVMKYKTSENVTTPQTELFLCAGQIPSATGGKSIRFDHGKAGEWHTQIVDLTEIDYWKDTIYGFRIDFFAGNANAGEYMDIEYIAFAKTAEEAEAYANGTAEIPTVPEEAAEITVKANSGISELGDRLIVPCGFTAYELFDGLKGDKLEVLDDKGISVRNEKLSAGDTVVSHLTDMSIGAKYSIAVKGDVDSDKRIGCLDAARLLYQAADLVEFDELALALGDVNGDGAVDGLDAEYVLKVDAGLINP